MARRLLKTADEHFDHQKDIDSLAMCRGVRRHKDSAAPSRSETQTPQPEDAEQKVSWKRSSRLFLQAFRKGTYLQLVSRAHGI